MTDNNEHYFITDCNKPYLISDNNKQYFITDNNKKLIKVMKERIQKESLINTTEMT